MEPRHCELLNKQKPLAAQAPHVDPVVSDHRERTVSASFTTASTAAIAVPAATFSRFTLRGKNGCRCQHQAGTLISQTKNHSKMKWFMDPP